MRYIIKDQSGEITGFGDCGVGNFNAGEPAGLEWVADDYEFPAPPKPDPVEQPQDWWVYVGPFKDRLGMDAPAIAASTHDACKGVMAMLSDRKYVDLKGDKAAMMLDILIATNQPTANPIFPGSGPMTAEKKAAILGTKPTDEERYKGAA